MTHPTKQLIIPAESLRDFMPSGLGAFEPRFRALVVSFPGRRQSEITSMLRAEAESLREAEGIEAKALRLTLLVLADYVGAGYYPVLGADRGLALAPVEASPSLNSEQRRLLLRKQYEYARERAISDRQKRSVISASLTALATFDYQPRSTVLAVSSGQPQVRLLNARADPSVRTLWRAVRSTWSMAPDSSAPGREISFLATDERFPETPLGIVQFRNVVPEIRRRDAWLGILAVSSDRDQAPDFATEVERFGDPGYCIRSTRGTLEHLLSAVRRDGLPKLLDQGALADLGTAASIAREQFDSSRRLGDKSAASRHLAATKRAETASDLIRGIGALRRLEMDADPLAMLRGDDAVRKDLDAGLRKIWHYHMGFVALEMSICGAAPPFGSLRTGKLMAALAATQPVVDAWGVDRPLGQIASTVYESFVRDLVPNPGPLVIFTSGLYPGHSAQYNRVRIGRLRWRKIGATQGWGNSLISAQTTSAADEFNTVRDGYEHITRAFGEGSSARFRSLGRALDALSLPDLRQHDVQRPLYALPLVSDVPSVLLGWTTEVDRQVLDTRGVGEEWWHRWIEPRAEELAAAATREPDLVDVLMAIDRAAERTA